MNEQREIMYAERRRVLDGESMRNSIMKMITDYVENVVNRCVSEDKDANEWDYDEINELLLPTIPIERVEYRENIKNKNELIHDLKEKAVKLYEDKEALFPEAEQIREIERVILLKVLTESGWIISMIWISFVKVSDYRHMDREIRLWNTNSPDLICSMQ